MTNNTLKSKQPCPFDCGSSDAYSEKLRIDGSAFGKCFSCLRWTNLDGNYEPVSNTARYLELSPQRLLACRIYDIPATFLRQYGVGYVDQYRISDKAVRYNQLVLQSILDGEYRGCQLKNLKSTDKSYKYMTLAKDDLVYYTKLKTEHCETLVITEDWCSAVKVKYATGLEALALTGSSLARTSFLMGFILKICPDDIIIWLDNDYAGRKGAYMTYKTLSNLFPTRVVQQDEPKLLSIEKIKETLA